MSFLKNLLINLVSFTIIGVLGVLVLVFFAVSGDEKPEGKPNSILHIKLLGKLIDRPNSNEFPFGASEDCVEGLVPVNKAIHSAIDDDNVKALLLEVGDLHGGVANLASLRSQLKEFQSTGKKVYVYSDGMSQLGYYLSSVADSIFINPVSHIEWKGLGAQLMYFKSMLDKIGVKAEPIRVGKYKSAIEPFVLDEMSDANEHQIKELLFDLWGNIVADVSADRGISEKKLNELANELGCVLPGEAVSSGLVDALKYEDEIWDLLRAEVDQDFSLVNVKEFNVIHSAEPKSLNKVAVVYAEGAIIDGKEETDMISSDQYTQILDDILNDKYIKALVLRVNSPGGSAKASDQIWRKISLINKNMPVIVSMGDVAASGGYYIATAADTILAEKGTVTGSIGVFGLMFNVGELTNKIGVNIERVKTNDLSDFPSFDRSLTDKEKARLSASVEEIYSIFLQHVEEGRGLTSEAVERLAQGRVWSGSQALDLGLIDEIGSLEDAIEIAVNSAGLEDYRLVELPKEMSVIEKVLKTVNENQVLLPAPFAEYNYMIENPDFFSEFTNPQARLPFVLTIE